MTTPDAGPPAGHGAETRLLAVDLGLATGFALMSSHPRLERVGSRRFASRSALRSGASTLLREVETPGGGPPAVVVLEGDRDLARIWARRAEHRGARTLQVPPEQWRAVLLHPREQRNAREAKQAARRLAPVVARTFGSTVRTSLGSDAAEAVLIGLWALLELGWIAQLPAELDPRRR